MRHRSRMWAVAVGLALVALPAVAAGGGGGTWLGVPRVVFLWGNLAIFFGLGAYYIWPAFLRFLESKGEEIRKAYDEARRQNQEMATMGGRLEAQIAELHQEVEDLKARAEREGQAERQEIIAQAERERDRILAQTKAEVDYRFEQARRQLTRHTAELAAQLTREMLETELTADDRSRLFAENVRRLEEGGRA